MTLVLVAIGAAIGAPLRYLTDRFVQSRHESAFPFGTLVVNVVGSFILGLTLGGASDAETRALVGTGFCGALTTYSTFSYETVRLAETTAKLLAVLNVVSSLVAGIGAAAAGWWIAA